MAAIERYAGDRGDLVDAECCRRGLPGGVVGFVAFDGEDGFVVEGNEGGAVDAGPLAGGGFDLEGVVVAGLTREPATKPEVAFGVEVAGIAGAVPDAAFEGELVVAWLCRCSLPPVSPACR